MLAPLAAASLTTVVYLSVGNPLDPFDDQRFTAARWHGSDPESRAPIARSVARRHLTPGLSSTQVLALVGQPDNVYGRGDDRTRGDQTYSYYLGNWSLYGFDDAFLYVHLDAQGKVITAEVTGY